MIATGKGSRRVSMELCGVNEKLLAVDSQHQLGDNSQLVAQAKEDQQHVQWHEAGHAIGASDLELLELPAFFFKPRDLPDDKLHLEGIAQLFHLAHRCRSCTETAPAVDDHCPLYTSEAADE